MERRGASLLKRALERARPRPTGSGRGPAPAGPSSSRELADGRARLQGGWVIANHLLVSFHVAFISSVLALPADATSRADVLRFIFTSHETLTSALFVWITFHTGVAVHELGHFLKAARLRALDDELVNEAQAHLTSPLLSRWAWIGKLFLLAPYGRAPGIKRQGLNYYPDAPYNLAVAAAGPRASRNLALVALPPALVLLAVGLAAGVLPAIYAGRLLLGQGVVGLLDFLLADPGKYREFMARERQARESAAAVERGSAWRQEGPQVLARVRAERMQSAQHQRLGTVAAPWQFRNCGMGGRHTEKEYPESNVSMQEAMFLILGARSSQESQEMTVRLQNRLKELIEKAEGCRVMGIGLEGGLAPYIDRGDYPLPEVRLWALMKQAIEECGYRPGRDVAVALDPAMSELEIAYREEFEVEGSVGMYLFWRDQGRTVLDRDAVLALFERALDEYEIPILSIEDGFSEDDHQGWTQLLERLGQRVLVIGDDLVTTNDRTIEEAARKGLINSVLVKANQIGTLYETLLAVLVTLGKGLEVVVSHRSKSPNDDMEAHLALAFGALGMKCGGGANTERLVKYQAVTTLMERLAEQDASDEAAPEAAASAIVRRVRAREEPTNAGIPTVGAEVELALPGVGVPLSFRGATPLGTSAGTGEAVHLVDRFHEVAEKKELYERHRALFRESEPGVVAFAPDVGAAQVAATGDAALQALYERARRYGGKGCLNAVDNVVELLAPRLEGCDVARWSLLDVDRRLLRLEVETARRRGKLSAQAAHDERIRVAQRKQNLGMNALLSVSLALARGVARVQGKELYELVREELYSVVERLAGANGVRIEGGRFDDYLVALREVDRRVAARGGALYEELRRVTGLYDEETAPQPAPTRPSPAAAEAPARAAAPVAASARPPVADAPAERAADGRPGQPAQDPLESAEAELVGSLVRALHAAWAQAGGESTRDAALQLYLQVKSCLARRTRRFEIVNNRVFRRGGALRVPLLVDDVVVLLEVDGGGQRCLARRRFPRGTIFSDEALASLSGEGAGAGEVVDLERAIFQFDPALAGDVHVERIRDLVALLERLNRCGSRQEVVYHLRFAVARLCSLSFRGFLGAKNLQPELRRLSAELARLLNGPFAYRLRLPMRILVRNVSGLVSRPKLIDELWKDTVDLSEVLVRGSALTNELRRSTHHALGPATLRLARAYLRFLESGETAGLPDPGPEAVSAVDEAARARPEARRLVARIVDDLETILGSSAIAARLEEWRRSYAETLLATESETSVEDELEALVEGGIGARNRWVYGRHLRVLGRKAGTGTWTEGAGRELARRLADLERLEPEAPGFEAQSAEQAARAAVRAFVDALRAEHQAPLFVALDDVLASYARGDFLLTWRALGPLRREVDRLLEVGAFEAQRYLLHQLDCLLEEMGFLALRHVAAGYEEHGVKVRECLEIVHGCAGNLVHDGLLSRELWDLAALLQDPGLSADEQLEVLAAIQRNYHRLVQRVSVAYERMVQRLGLGADELRAVLGNFQRYLHDLNSLVHFVDLARRHLQAGERDPSGGGNGEAAHDAAESAWDFLHLSHTDEITRRVESWDPSLDLLGRYGGKGSGLLYLSYLGVPTRDGFVVPMTLARAGLHLREPERLARAVEEHVRSLEVDIARRDARQVRFGDPRRPLLLAVRGGSVFSMPGMLSTVVFVGMSDAVAEELARDDPWQAYDAYRRFLGSYAQAAWGVDVEAFDLVEQAKRRHGVALKVELPGEAMREVAEATRARLVELGHGAELEALLADPRRQLEGAVQAVLASWQGERARRYREVVGLSEGWQSAVVVQEMARGNYRNEEVRPGMDEARASLTGVIPCTRMDELGARAFTGDVKFSASGDDLVGGLTMATSFRPVQQLATHLPMLERMLQHVDARVRRFRGTDPEIEFTVERGVLSVLQARMALSTVELDRRAFAAPGEPQTRGIGIRGGAFRGLVAFTREDLEALRAEASARADVDGVLLVIENPTPEEIPLLLAADGMLTVRGGSTSHAAVAVHGVEGRSYCAVMSAEGLRVDPAGRRATLPAVDGGAPPVVRAGEVLSIHGTSGEVHLGSLPLAEAHPTATEPQAAERGVR